VFGQTGASNEVATTRYAKPAAWESNTSSYVSRLGNNAGKNIGPNTLQKVMAGDKISAIVQYYFNTQASGNNTNFVSASICVLQYGFFYNDIQVGCSGLSL